MVKAETIQEQSRLNQIPIGYWLMLAAFVAGLYIFVLMRLDGARAKALNFRYTSEQVLDLASHDSSVAKPSPFGKPVRAARVARQTSTNKGLTTLAQALPSSGVRQMD